MSNTSISPVHATAKVNHAHNMVTLDEKIEYTPFLRYRLSGCRPVHQVNASRRRTKPSWLRQGNENQGHDHRRRPRPKPSLTDHQPTGGLRRDPFKAIPADTTLPAVGDALDFCEYLLS